MEDNDDDNDDDDDEGGGLFLCTLWPGLSKFVRLARSVTRNRAAGQPTTTIAGASPNHLKSDAPKYSQLANVSSPICTCPHV